MNCKVLGNQDLQTHYQTRLGLNSPRRVDCVDLDISNRTVDIHFSHAEGVKITCPEYVKTCGLADHASMRRWRHLDAMQCVTTLMA